MAANTTSLAGSQQLAQLDSPLSQQLNNGSKSHLITLNFSTIEVRKILQILAQFSGINFVISSKISGTMSIHLKNVSWRTALKVILKSQNLGETRIGNTIMVAPIDDIASAQLAELKSNDQIQQAEPVTDKIIFLKYASAKKLAAMLSEGTAPIIAGKGQVRINERTNSLWIRDTPRALRKISQMVAILDHPVKQVEIYARIVSVDKEYEKELGTRLGVTNPYTMSGTLESANALQTLQNPALARQTISQQYYDNYKDTLALKDRLSFDAPSTGKLFSDSQSFKSGSIAFSLLKIGHNMLDLEISALEGEQHLMNLASPRIVTSNNEEATIKQGQEIPYTTTSPSGGTEIEYRSANLELRVTPQITPDHRVMLKLHITNNSPSTSNSSGTIIKSEEEDSNILLDDNQTIVIGGIFKEDKKKQVVRVPILGQIPLIGRFFTFKEDQDYKNELMIFITPHIINKPSELSSEFAQNGSV
jgi:type IV pilus assembly protein PilQ